MHNLWQLTKPMALFDPLEQFEIVSVVYLWTSCPSMVMNLLVEIFSISAFAHLLVAWQQVASKLFYSTMSFMTMMYSRQTTNTSMFFKKATAQMSKRSWQKHVVLSIFFFSLMLFFFLVCWPATVYAADDPVVTTTVSTGSGMFMTRGTRASLLLYNFPSPWGLYGEMDWIRSLLPQNHSYDFDSSVQAMTRLYSNQPHWVHLCEVTYNHWMPTEISTTKQMVYNLYIHHNIITSGAETCASAYDAVYLPAYSSPSPVNPVFKTVSCLQPLWDPTYDLNFQQSFFQFLKWYYNKPSYMSVLYNTKHMTGGSSNLWDLSMTYPENFNGVDSTHDIFDRPLHGWSDMFRELAKAAVDDS